ncbi:hypothetical protein [Devosia sp. 2618]|uniref:hypothetical protein n=1 Tax=Devosia sp. 2618 TaxID=3156454 RepID=UPI00339304A8
MAEKNQITVRIESRFPVFIEADADAFGQIFASMASDEQSAVLAAMAEHMRPHQTQWDHIAIELEKPENAQTRSALQQALFPEVYAQASRIEELEKALREIERTAVANAGGTL